MTLFVRWASAATDLLTFPISHSGMSGASAVVELSHGFIVVANDEDNQLRLYKTLEEGAPISLVDLSKFLQVSGPNLEADIEGAARIGSTIYWIGSHGRSKDGRLRPNRFRFFATEIIGTAEKPLLKPSGQPCRTLLQQLCAEPTLADLHLAEAAAMSPDKSGALNIEALAPGPNGSVYIGFRSPVPKGLALIIPLTNPKAVIAGQPARFGAPIFLDLDGRGLRDMTWDGHTWYLIGGGNGSENRSPKLYKWHGPNRSPKVLPLRGLKNLNPEAITLLASHSPPSLLLCSDDGSSKTKNASSFRSLRIQLSPH